MSKYKIGQYIFVADHYLHPGEYEILRILGSAGKEVKYYLRGGYYKLESELFETRYEAQIVAINQKIEELTKDIKDLKDIRDYLPNFNNQFYNSKNKTPTP